MSRIGRMPIDLPPGVVVNIKENQVSVKGPKGELKRSLNPGMVLSLEDKKLLVARPSDAKQHRALHGLTRSLVANMVEGVTKGFEKNLEIVGVGFRVEKDGSNLVLRVGFTHTVVVKPRPGISFEVDAKSIAIKVSGIDKFAHRMPTRAKVSVMRERLSSLSLVRLARQSGEVKRNNG
jgi:large subunit ribosomal protein L6